MKIINAKTEILSPNMTSESINQMYQNIEAAGRTCYKSEDKITPESSRKFIRGLIKRGHEAMIEHASMTVRFTVDRGVSHEIVRHRIASFAQESTRYCNYSHDKFENQISVIKPFIMDEYPIGSKNEPDWMHTFVTNWLDVVTCCEKAYISMTEAGVPPEWARSVLPNSLKTEIVVTMNMRSWRHFFKLRAAGETGKPHPQMLEVAIPLLQQCKTFMPELFDDIQEMTS